MAFLDQFAPTSKADIPPPGELAAYKAANTSAALGVNRAVNPPGTETVSSEPQPMPVNGPSAPYGGFSGFGASGLTPLAVIALGAVAAILIVIALKV